jgi:predicted transcriptional regulator of viral defense system
MEAVIDNHLVGQVAKELTATGLSAVSRYEIAKLVFQRVKPDESPKAIYIKLTSGLQAVGLLTPLTPKKESFLLFGRENATPAELVCSLDPFCYMSHLSAMEHHGLTDRFPKILFMTTPSLGQWRDQAKQRMQRDLGELLERYVDAGLPKLTRPHISKMKGTTVEFHERSQLGAFRNVGESPLRVATIGRTFLDMLREPKLCGGIQHVIDIYRAHAKRYFRLIVDEVERHGSSIDKVRAGYILADVCKLGDPTIFKWASCAQRGGSRKLDPDAEYAPTYSETWMLSINVPFLTQPTEDSDDD